MSKSLPMRILDSVVLALCLPFYVIVIPLFRLSDRRFLNRILGALCPHCHTPLEELTTKSVDHCGIKIAQARGNVKWDRLPYRRITCPACRLEICYDKQGRTTSCDLSDALARKSQAKPSAGADMLPLHIRDTRQ